MPQPTRRLLLAALALQGCTAPLQPLYATRTTAPAKDRLDASAAAHGHAALPSVDDIAVGYTGAWRPLVNTLAPDLVDAGYRGSSQERLLPQAGLLAQTHTGPAGRKEVRRQTVPGTQGTIRVWLNGAETEDPNRLAAAALVADGYTLFLLGPMLLAQRQTGLVMDLAQPERITVFGEDLDCDLLRIRLTPGLGLSPQDDLALYIDRTTNLMRRVRFTLNGLDATRGAIAEVDTAAHLPLHAIQWPTRFHEHLLRPAPIPVHDWHVTNLTVGSTLRGNN